MKYFFFGFVRGSSNGFFPCLTILTSVPSKLPQNPRSALLRWPCMMPGINLVAARRGFAWSLCKCIDHIDQGVCILHGQIIYGEIELMDDRWCWPQTSFLSNREKLANYYMFQEICGTVWSVLLDDCDLGESIKNLRLWDDWIPMEASLGFLGSHPGWHPLDMAFHVTGNIQNQILECPYEKTTSGAPGRSEVGSWRFWYRFFWLLNRKYLVVQVL